jgi:hypothetical protein
MDSLLLAATQIGKPALIGIGIAALVVLFLAFKVTKFAIKMILMLVAFAAIAGAAWHYFATHVH